jgi:hypothetical protein
MQCKLFSSTLKSGTSQKSGKPYSFYEYLVQVDQATAPSAVVRVTGDKDLAPGMYDCDVEISSGQFQKPLVKLVNFRAVK